MSGIFEKQRGITAALENALSENSGTVSEPVVMITTWHHSVP